MASMLPTLSPSRSTMVAPCQLRTVSTSGMCSLLWGLVVGVLPGGAPGAAVAELVGRVAVGGRGGGGADLLAQLGAAGLGPAGGPLPVALHRPDAAAADGDDHGAE